MSILLDRKKTLFIGCGACGNKIVNDILESESRFDGLFINTSIKDLQTLKHATNKNMYIIPNADGTGKNRDLGKSYVKEYVSSMVDLLSKYPMHDIIYFVFSMGGGSGSSLSPLVIKLAKKIFPNKIINVVAVKPRTDSSTKILENTKDTWNDIVKLKDCINQFLFVDNNKKDNEEEINKKLVEDINSLYGISNAGRQVIDGADAGKLVATSGNAYIYKLRDEFKDDIELALNVASKESIYYERTSDYCTNIGVSIKEGVFDLKTVVNKFKYEEDAFEGYNKENLVVVTGCAMPKLMIELINEELANRQAELEKRKAERHDDEDLLVETKVKEKKTEDKVDDIDLSSSKKIEDILGDGFFDDLL